VKRIEFFTRNKKTTLVIGIVLILALILAFGLPRDGAAAENAYQTETAGRGNLSAVVGATGAVRAKQSVALSWATGGVVEQVAAQQGDAVRAGTVLAELKQDSLPQSVILAGADLVSAQQALDDLLHSDTEQANAAIALREARDAYESAEDYRLALNDKVEYDIFKIVNGVPKVKHVKYYPGEEQKTKADETLALAAAHLKDAQRAYDHVIDGPNADDIAAAEARVAAARATLDQSRIIAPFAGVITDASVLPGDKVSAATPAFQLDDLSHLLIDLEVSEVDINSVAVGQVVTVNFDAVQGKDYRGEVVSVAGAGSSLAGSVNFKVTVELTDADELVRPGMTAAVLIQVRSVEDALLVPNRSVRVVDAKRVVYVLNEDGALTPVEVHLGATSDTYSEVVGGGLREGDRVVLNPPAASNFEPGGGPMNGNNPFGG
jgi:HlyD family secretion protein